MCIRDRELILRHQMLLLDELVAADVRQYGLLVGEVSGEDEVDGRKVGVGRFAEEFRQSEMTSEVKRSSDDNNARKSQATTAIGKSESGDSDITNLAGEAKRKFEDDFLLRDNELGGEKTKFEGEKAAHEADRKAFVDNLKKIARIKQQTTIKRADADGKITYSDDTRKSLHIDLGLSLIHISEPTRPY